MRATLIAEFGLQGDVSSVSYEPQTLVVKVESAAGVSSVTFTEVIGFRVLDEGDLIEFWPVCSSRQAALFEIHDGGWLTQEKQRNGFLSGTTRPMLREYIVTGEDECVSVFSLQQPRVEGHAL